MNNEKHNEVNVGIDTSKDKLDILVRPSGEFFTYSNSVAGANAAARKIKQHKPTRVLIEATGRLQGLVSRR